MGKMADAFDKLRDDDPDLAERIRAVGAAEAAYRGAAELAEELGEHDGRDKAGLAAMAGRGPHDRRPPGRGRGRRGRPALARRLPPRRPRPVRN